MVPDVPYRYARTKKLLGQILKEMKAVHEGMIQEALTVQRDEGGQIGQILVRLGHLDEATLQQGLARQAGLDMFDLSSVQFTPELLESVDPETAKLFDVLPVKQRAGQARSWPWATPRTRPSSTISGS